MAMPDKSIVLEAKNITKQFPGVLANDKVNFNLQKGEIHALLGENGAGKSTLMNVLYGLYQPDDGEIAINGKPVAIHSPNNSIALGIGMVHQHFMLIPVFTVAENVMLGDETVRNGFLDRNAVSDKVRQLSKQYGLDVDPLAIVGQLPVGVQQRVEIMKTLYRDAQILILDEPTAVLTPQEVQDLFKVLRLLVEKGKSIIFITHKLKEVLEVANRITVMRAGRVTGTVTPRKVDERKLAEMMVGREVNLTILKKAAEPKQVILDVRHLLVSDERGHRAVNDVSFDVRAGEVLGIAGVQGNGQTELVYALTGLLPSQGGEIRLLGKTLHNSTPRQIIEMGVAHIPEDRQKHGLVLSFPIYDNLVLCTYYLKPNARGLNMQSNVIVDSAREIVKQFDVRTPSASMPVSHLSGGNQQKVIVAREFSRPIKLLIASQPTRGLDVGSIEYIHAQIITKRDEGVAVLVVSSELDEIMALSDRIAVIFRGQIVGVLPAADATKEKLGLLMMGVQAAEISEEAKTKTRVERVF